MGGALIIVDCYENLYVPNESEIIGSPPDNIEVSSCDPRNPVEVQKKVTAALRLLQKKGIRDVRLVYDSLSDFLSIADQELVVSYLRRSIVWEETLGIKSLYLVWPHLITGPLSDDYLSWFGNTTLWLYDKKTHFRALLEGVENRPITCHINGHLEITDMIQFSIDEARTGCLAQILKDLNYNPDEMSHITPFKGDPYREMHFIFFLTAIDHNTHGARRYETQVDGATIHGSDLLYHQARVAATRDQDLFTPLRMKNLSMAELNQIFTVEDDRKPKNLPERQHLLQQAGTLLDRQYSGDLAHLFAKGDFRLRSDAKPGILELLRAFKAYEDPLEKKSFLLIKLLRRRSLLTIADPENISAPIDHVLFTIALRSGMVVADESMHKAILAEECLTDANLAELRMASLAAYQLVAKTSGIPVDVFDDLLWAYGRECLRMPLPLRQENLNIRTPLDNTISGKAALAEFLRFINGIDGLAPGETSHYPVPIFPETVYF